MFSPETLRSEAMYAEKNLGNDAQVYYAAAGQSLDEALVNSRAMLDVCDSLKHAGKLKAYSPVASLLFVPEDVQNERIAAWDNFWNSPDCQRRYQCGQGNVAHRVLCT